MITLCKEADYVRIEVTGEVTIRELLEYAQTNVKEWLLDTVIWDLSEGRIAKVESDYDAVSGIVSNIHDLVEARKGQETIFVAPDLFSYGMLRMAIMIVEVVESTSVASVFTSMEEAKASLRGRSD